MLETAVTMDFNETILPGVYLIDPCRIEDERGFFSRAWSARDFAARGLASEFPEVNLSRSTRKGTIRGLHYQKPPHGEAKLVRCIRGALFDVVVDLRPGSPTLHQWLGVELTAESHRTIYIPAGCAHGALALEDGAEMYYMVSSCYNPAAEAGIRWDDPWFGIRWPDVGAWILSAKDLGWPDYRPADGFSPPNPTRSCC